MRKVWKFWQLYEQFNTKMMMMDCSNANAVWSALDVFVSFFKFIYLFLLIYFFKLLDEASLAVFPDTNR